MTKIKKSPILYLKHIGGVDLKHQEYNLKDTEKYLIVKCLSDAIGDDVKACIQREHINDRKSNAKKFLKWDLINRNFITNFSGVELTAEYAKRGAWHFVPLFNKETGTLFSIMREELFNELQRKQQKRRKAHYIDALVKSFNINLEQNNQLSLFEEDKFDEYEIKAIVDEILRDFQIDSSVVNRYVTILFKEYNSELVSIRACVLDSSLQVVNEDDWNEFIHYNESVVVDTVDKDAEEREMPKIKLKDKARKRMGQKDVVAIRDDITIENIQIL